jgi:hypothetical protein
MIQYNIKYDLNNGQGWISFEKAGEGFVSAQYNRGTIQGHWDGDKLKGQFIDTVSNGKGLIEFSFNETGFEAKWKAGIEEGPMKGKWVGKLEIQKSTIPTQLSSVHFEELIGIVKVLSFNIDNTYEAIDEKGGDERFKLSFDLENQLMLPESIFPPVEEAENKMLYYTGSPFIEFYGDYINNEFSEYPGYLMITNENWGIPFHGELENADGELDFETYTKIKEVVNSKTIYNFLQEAYSFLCS